MRGEVRQVAAEPQSPTTPTLSKQTRSKAKQSKASSETLRKMRASNPQSASCLRAAWRTLRTGWPFTVASSRPAAEPRRAEKWKRESPKRVHPCSALVTQNGGDTQKPWKFAVASSGKNRLGPHGCNEQDARPHLLITAICVQNKS